MNGIVLFVFSDRLTKHLFQTLQMMEDGIYLFTLTTICHYLRSFFYLTFHSCLMYYRFPVL